ncbi:MAG: ABC transporter substrate-binding protein, partial [Gemmatimonadales bacterium]
MSAATRLRSRLSVIAVLAMWCSPRAGAQTEAASGTGIVILTGQQATTPVPTLMEGAANSTGNLDVIDQLFLRLAELGPKLLTTGDRDFGPALARSWTRRDSTTLVFDLDPRARWHDGAPVTARDVVFTINRAKNPDLAPRASDLL